MPPHLALLAAALLGLLLVGAAVCSGAGRRGGRGGRGGGGGGRGGGGGGRGGGGGGGLLGSEGFSQAAGGGAGGAGGAARARDVRFKPPSSPAPASAFRNRRAPPAVREAPFVN